MTTSGSRETAKIYAFPARGRFAPGNPHEDSVPQANIQAPRGVMVASGSGWYHDEAIQAEQCRKN